MKMRSFLNSYKFSENKKLFALKNTEIQQANNLNGRHIQRAIAGDNNHLARILKMAIKPNEVVLTLA